jgi:uncharacterized FlgJ-related protein
MKCTFLLSIVILGFVCSCKQNQEPMKSQTILSEEEYYIVDTLVNSFPENYVRKLKEAPASNKMDVTSYKDLLDLFQELVYTAEAWEAGLRLVPRVYLTNIGPRWGSQTRKEITVEYKKRIFFRGIAPLILYANEGIMSDRNRLERLRKDLLQNDSLFWTDEIWLMRLARLYKVKAPESREKEALFDELWKKVDIIPASLALAQGAVESGWGTSRFAAKGNALYGQWSWGDDAMIPEAQRKELGNYGIAAFPSLQESVCAYMLNLNTHPAYAELRAIRAELREKGEKPNGYILADGLIKYSEKGPSYIQTLKNMMEYNHLAPLDEAVFSNDPPLFLIPVAR